MSDSSFPLSPRRIFDLKSLRWREVEWLALLVALLLVGFGLVLQEAMASAQGREVAGGVNYAAHRTKVLVSLPLLLMALFLRPAWLRKSAPWLYGLSIALLLAVWVVGVERNNARRWIPLPAFDLQPSEIAKVGLVLVLATLLAKRRLEEPREWLLPLLALFLPMVLVIKQPDLGTALIFLPVFFGMMHLAGASARAITLLILSLGLTGFLAWRVGVVHDYQLERIETWAQSYEPSDLIAGRRGPAFHSYHARVAIGNGGLTGTGLGQGTSNLVGALPERDSDSIFAVIAEEFGLLGALAVILLDLALPVLLMLAAARQRDRFARLVTGGVALYFAAHLVVHVSVNTGLLPLTGLPLPFLSAGGSSLLASSLALGLALGLAAHRGRSLDRDSFRAY